MSSNWFTFLRLNVRERFFLDSREFLEHFAAKWLAFPHEEHVFPYAGHLSLLRSCLLPQYLHLALSWSFGSLLFSLSIFGFLELSFWLTAFTSCSVVWLGAMSFSCAVVASFTRQMSTHFDSVKPDSWSSFLRMPLSRTPQTIPLSRIRSSFKAPNSQVSVSAII